MHKKELRRRAGVLVPLFSVYSKRSFGIGDFEDLKLLIDWCSNTGNSILQLLPMNEAGPTFCPYDSISSFALEPMYVYLKGQGARGPAPFASLRYGAGKGQGKATASHVDYRVKEEKYGILLDIFKKEAGLDSKEFKKFVAENAYWLDDFSMYKALKSYHGGAPWYEWNEGYRGRDGFVLEEFVKEHGEELNFYKWVQWILFKQFKKAREYAESKKVSLKGDLPILVSRDSADVWAHQEFFKLDYAAGAPPDMYCAKGQRWGMPTYDWGNIEADGFRYIKERLKYAQNFYDILRIDHVVGLFRIWSIPYNEPMENQGLNGFFDPADENYWAEHGRKLLSVLQDNTSMLLCAEDLGIIPKVCPDTLKEMRIPGNDVQRWTKDWNVGHDFLSPGQYRELSAAMLSTHDTTNWAAWWENEAGTVDEKLFLKKCNERGIDFNRVKEALFDPGRSRHGRLRWRPDADSVDKYAGILAKRPEELKDFIEMYENTYLEKEKLWKRMKLKGRMREKSDPGILKAALEITAASKSVFCIELIFDLLGLAGACKGDPYDFRINTPGTVSCDNWSLKIPLPLEELLEHEVNKEIKKIITAADRA